VKAIDSSFVKNDYDLIVSAANAYRQATIYHKAEEYYKKAVKLKPNVSSCSLQNGNGSSTLARLIESAFKRISANSNPNFISNPNPKAQNIFGENKITSFIGKVSRYH